MTISAAEPAPLSTRFVHHLTHHLTRWWMVEPEVSGLSSVVRAGDSVLDVGAAYGMYTYPLASIVGPTGRVVSFEPQPKQRRILTMMRALLRLHHIHVDDSALGATAGEKSLVLPTFFGVPIYGHAHVAASTAGASTPPARRRPVTVRTVDDSCQRWGIDRVAFMKLDVEGFELDVVRGAAQIIERSQPSILLELENRHTVRYGHAATDVVAYILTTWPEYRMYTWVDGAWKRTYTVSPEIRNYLFATPGTLQA